MSRPTYQQLEALAEFLMLNPGIAKGLLRSAHGKHETKRKWDEISSSLNALGGAQKDGKGWAKYWADKKCALKKTCAQRAHLLRESGRGADVQLPDLTPIDQRLVAVMGGAQFAEGDSHVAINPFPSTSQIPNYGELERVAETQTVDGLVKDSSLHTVEIVTEQNIPSSPRERSPLQESHSTQRQRARAGRTVLDAERQRFATIEAQRVDAEAITARAFSQAVEHMANLTAAIEVLSTATRDGAQTVADALIQIANALQRN